MSDVKYKKNILHIISCLKKLDCSSSACLFKSKNAGQRTSGGCSCLTGFGTGLRLALLRTWDEHKNIKLNGKSD